MIRSFKRYWYSKNPAIWLDESILVYNLQNGIFADIRFPSENRASQGLKKQEFLWNIPSSLTFFCVEISVSLEFQRKLKNRFRENLSQTYRPIFTLTSMTSQDLSCQGSKNVELLTITILFIIKLYSRINLFKYFFVFNKCTV